MIDRWSNSWYLNPPILWWKVTKWFDRQLQFGMSSLKTIISRFRPGGFEKYLRMSTEQTLAESGRCHSTQIHWGTYTWDSSSPSKCWIGCSMEKGSSALMKLGSERPTFWGKHGIPRMEVNLQEWMWYNQGLHWLPQLTTSAILTFHSCRQTPINTPTLNSSRSSCRYSKRRTNHSGRTASSW